MGSGKIGGALARIFARKNIRIAIANSRGPDSLASFTAELGSAIEAKTMQDATSADVIFLAFPFSAYKIVASQRTDWSGKILVDATNAFGIAAEELGGRLSSEVIAGAFAGARVVKGFNHLPAAKLGAAPQQAIFIASDDNDASDAVIKIVSDLGLAPVDLGKLRDGGVPLHVVGGKPGGLLLKNLALLA